MPLIVNGSVMRQPKLPLVPGAGGVPAWMETGLSAAPPWLSPFSTSSRYRAKQSRTRLLRMTASSRAASSARRSTLTSELTAKSRTSRWTRKEPESCSARAPEAFAAGPPAPAQRRRCSVRRFSRCVSCACFGPWRKPGRSAAVRLTARAKASAWARVSERCADCDVCPPAEAPDPPPWPLPPHPASKKTASTKTAGSTRPLALRRDPHSARALDAGVRLCAHPLVGVPPRGVRDASLTQGVSRTCRRLRAPAAAFAHLPPPSRTCRRLRALRRRVSASPVPRARAALRRHGRGQDGSDPGPAGRLLHRVGAQEQHRRRARERARRAVLERAGIAGARRRARLLHQALRVDGRTVRGRRNAVSDD